MWKLENLDPEHAELEKEHGERMNALLKDKSEKLNLCLDQAKNEMMSKECFKKSEAEFRKQEKAANEAFRSKVPPAYAQYLKETEVATKKHEEAMDEWSEESFKTTEETQETAYEELNKDLEAAMDKLLDSPTKDNYGSLM